ncbi:MAG: glycosyltransferase [Acidimicrobiia bacterium]
MRSRLQLLGRSARSYLTPFRIVLLVVFVLGLILTMSDYSWIKVAGIAISAVALILLLAQLNSQSRSTYGVSFEAVPDGAVVLEPAPQPTRADLRRTPLVSVVIPGKNEAEYVADCIESLKRQTLTTFEALIVDDGSTDNTLAEILEAVDGDPRFRILRTPESIGPGRARNLGVMLARAETVTFLDLDDFLAPESLATRLEMLERHADQPWVGGVYCWHEGVARSMRYENWERPTWQARNERISWLQRPDDNVFVVSAPLLRKAAFLAVGGFGDTIGEDAHLWLTMLRAGFVFRGTGRIDIAYRQKPRSRAASDYLGMGQGVAERVAEGQHALERPDGLVGPYWFGAAMADYRASLALSNRLSASLGMAVALGHLDDASRLADEIAKLPPPVVVEGWETDAIGHAKNGAVRIALAEDYSPLLPGWEISIENLLQSVVDRAQESSRQWISEITYNPNTDLLQPVHQRPRVQVTSSSIGSLVDGGTPFLLMPSAAYHTDELTELVPELRRRGYAPVAMINDFRWTTTESAMATVDVPVVDVLEPGEWLDRFAGVLVFNDWGEYYAETVRYLADRPVATFAKVEGVQDWHDRDTGRSRNAYMSADVVLCQGQNDVSALSGRRQGLEIVGSDRLQRVWQDQLPPDGQPSVVANVNFTYGVLTEHRDLWVSTALEAARDAQLPITLSIHPSEQTSYPDLASSEPLRHLFTTDSIFVSRFSTAIYEALGRGCNVVYYNPHDEQVETFQKSDGAFEIATSQAELSDALRRASRRPRSEVKAAASDMFHAQVSIEEGRSVAHRTADVIDAHVQRSHRA